MIDGLGTELNSIIDNICAKLGTTVDALVPELCKYKLYESIGYITAFSIISAFIIITMLIVFALWQKAESSSGEYEVLELCLGAVLFLFICGIAYQVYFFIVWKNAPTGAAVDYVIQQLKNH